MFDLVVDAGKAAESLGLGTLGIDFTICPDCQSLIFTGDDGHYCHGLYQANVESAHNRISEWDKLFEEAEAHICGCCGQDIEFVVETRADGSEKMVPQPCSCTFRYHQPKRQKRYRTPVGKWKSWLIA